MTSLPYGIINVLFIGDVNVFDWWVGYFKFGDCFTCGRLQGGDNVHKRIAERYRAVGFLLKVSRIEFV